MKTVIEIAREAKLPEAWISETGVLKWSDLERFAELVRAAERKACEQICIDMYLSADMNTGKAAMAIAARGNI